MKLDSSLGCFIILLSVLGGVLLGAPLADASGLIFDVRYHELMATWRICCGVLAAVFLIYAFRTLLYFSLIVIGILRQRTIRPNSKFATTLIVAGTLCLLATLGLECMFLYRYEVQATSPAVHLQGTGADLSMAVGWGRPTLMLLIAQAFAGLVFLAGSIMISLGVWSSIPPQSCTK